MSTTIINSTRLIISTSNVQLEVFELDETHSWEIDESRRILRVYEVEPEKLIAAWFDVTSVRVSVDAVVGAPA